VIVQVAVRQPAWAQIGMKPPAPVLGSMSRWPQRIDRPSANPGAMAPNRRRAPSQVLLTRTRRAQREDHARQVSSGASTRAPCTFRSSWQLLECRVALGQRESLAQGATYSSVSSLRQRGPQLAHLFRSCGRD